MLRLALRPTTTLRVVVVFLTPLAVVGLLSAGVWTVALAVAAMGSAIMWITKWARPDELDLIELRSSSRRVTLRRPRDDDRDALIDIAGQPHNVEIQGHAQTGAAATEPKIWWLYCHTTFVVVDARSRKVLGAITAADRLDPPVTTVGVSFAADGTGSGIATEALGAALTFWREAIAPDRALHVETAIDNHSMRAVMERLGFEPEAEPFDHELPDGRAVVAVRYVIDRLVADEYRPSTG